MAYLTQDVISLEALVAQVTHGEVGGIATFLGVVRDHHEGRSVSRLEYSAYPAMAEAECGRLVNEAESRWPCRVALAHRVGPLEIGDTAVAIAVGSAHRAEAFEACRWIIEQLKHRVPIWKRERYVDGTEAWVNPAAPSGIQAALRAPR